MMNRFDDMPFFGDEPEPAPQRAVGSGGIAARAMAQRDAARAAPDYLDGLNPSSAMPWKHGEGQVWFSPAPALARRAC